MADFVCDESNKTTSGMHSENVIDGGTMHEEIAFSGNISDDTITFSCFYPFYLEDATYVGEKEELFNTEYASDYDDYDGRLFPTILKADDNISVLKKTSASNGGYKITDGAFTAPASAESILNKVDMHFVTKVGHDLFETAEGTYSDTFKFDSDNKSVKLPYIPIFKDDNNVAFSAYQEPQAQDGISIQFDKNGNLSVNEKYSFYQTDTDGDGFSDKSSNQIFKYENGTFSYVYNSSGVSDGSTVSVASITDGDTPSGEISNSNIDINGFSLSESMRSAVTLGSLLDIDMVLDENRSAMASFNILGSSGAQYVVNLKIQEDSNLNQIIGEVSIDKKASSFTSSVRTTSVWLSTEDNHVKFEIGTNNILSIVDADKLCKFCMDSMSERIISVITCSGKKMYQADNRGILRDKISEEVTTDQDIFLEEDDKIKVTVWKYDDANGSYGKSSDEYTIDDVSDIYDIKFTSPTDSATKMCIRFSKHVDSKPVFTILASINSPLGKLVSIELSSTTKIIDLSYSVSNTIYAVDKIEYFSCEISQEKLKDGDCVQVVSSNADGFLYSDFIFRKTADGKAALKSISSAPSSGINGISPTVSISGEAYSIGMSCDNTVVSVAVNGANVPAESIVNPYGLDTSKNKPIVPCIYSTEVSSTTSNGTETISIALKNGQTIQYLVNSDGIFEIDESTSDKVVVDSKKYISISPLGGEKYRVISNEIPIAASGDMKVDVSMAGIHLNTSDSVSYKDSAGGVLQTYKYRDNSLLKFSGEIFEEGFMNLNFESDTIDSLNIQLHETDADNFYALVHEECGFTFVEDTGVSNAQRIGTIEIILPYKGYMESTNGKVCPEEDKIRPQDGFIYLPNGESISNLTAYGTVNYSVVTSSFEYQDRSFNFTIYKSNDVQAVAVDNIDDVRKTIAWKGTDGLGVEVSQQDSGGIYGVGECCSVNLNFNETNTSISVIPNSLGAIQGTIQCVHYGEIDSVSPGNNYIYNVNIYPHDTETIDVQGVVTFSSETFSKIENVRACGGVTTLLNTGDPCIVIYDGFCYSIDTDATKFIWHGYITKAELDAGSNDFIYDVRIPYRTNKTNADLKIYPLLKMTDRTTIDITIQKAVSLGYNVQYTVGDRVMLTFAMCETKIKPILLNPGLSTYNYINGVWSD